MGMEVAIGAAIGGGLAAVSGGDGGDILKGAALGAVGGGIAGELGAAASATEVGAAEVFGPGIELASAENLAAAGGVFGPGVELASSGAYLAEMEGVDAAIASQIASGALPEATASLPELIAAQDGAFTLTAEEVSKGYRVVSTANNVAQKINSAGRVVAQAKAPTAGLSATLPTYQTVGSVPSFFAPPTAQGLNMAQGVTGAQVNAELAAQSAAANAGKITINNETIMALVAAGALVFFAKV